MAQVIKCPHCGKDVELEAAMSAALADQTDALLLLKEGELRQQLEEEKKAEMAAALEESRKKQEEHERQIRESQERESQLKAEQEQKQKDLQLQIELAQQEAERIRLESETAKRVSEEAMIQKQRELESKEEQLRIDNERQRLENERTLRDERVKQEAALREQMATEAKLKETESALTIQSLLKQVEDLKTAAKSQQLQGEAQEVALEEVLKMAFPEDIVESVPKGFKGADSLLRVKVGPHIIGTIIFESKRTKQWSGEWIPKLKDDQRTGSAEIAVLVTQAFPAEVKNRTAYLDGVWLTDFGSAMGLVMALRAGLIEVAKMKNLSTNGDEKSQALFQYVCSPEFRQAIQAIAETFITFKEEMAAEKRSMEKVWKRREKMLDRAILGTTRLHGGLQGILGDATMPDIEQPKALPEAV
jgi:hypothetical protein